MNYDEYFFIQSEIVELEALLKEIPIEDVIDRMGLEQRLFSAKEAIANYVPKSQPRKAKLTFRGNPVFGSHGIVASFAAKATAAFSDAFSAVMAENLAAMGPIPDKQKNGLVITAIATGSFGFELELPEMIEDVQVNNNQSLLPFSESELNKAEDTMEKMELLFRAAATGSDDEVTELVDQIHPRAVKKVAEFLDLLFTHEAWCGLTFSNNAFQFSDLEQVRRSAACLKSDNINETIEELQGQLLGVLPWRRTFEFKRNDNNNVINGKVGVDIQNPGMMNHKYLTDPTTIKFNVIRVGKGRPRYTIKSLSDIKDS